MGKQNDKIRDMMPVAPDPQEILREKDLLFTRMGKLSISFDPDLDRVERWRKVFELRKRGFSYKTVSKMLGCGEATVKRDYKKYITIRAQILSDQVLKKDINDVADALIELEYIKELAYDQQLTSEKGSPGYAAGVKLLLECTREIKELKLMIGAWGSFEDSGSFGSETYEERVKRIRRQRGLEEVPVKEDRKETLNIADKMKGVDTIDADLSEKIEIAKVDIEKADKKKKKKEKPFLEAIKEVE